MHIDDLRSFLVVARDANIRNAALELHQSPSALSKAIRRLEMSLNTPLFERSGKRLRLNDHGQQLRERALQLVALADLTEAEFRGERQQIHCRIAGPAVLQWRYGPELAQRLQAQFPNSGVAFDAQFEDAAVVSLNRGEADFALVTGAVVDAVLPTGIEAIALGSITMRLAAGLQHALLDQAQKPDNTTPYHSALTAQVLEHVFACPDRSLFCGIARGARSDGWRDDRLPRKIRYWLADLQLLMVLVKSSQALAYLPDFALEDPGLVRVKVSDCPYECVEQCWLLWKPSTASGWQNKLVASLPAVDFLSPT
jgi:DNA-binding transcriptional LysR family regulator